jgi:hypothetical protein
VRQSVPLLRSGNGITGPGGDSPFVTPTGQLKLAYHAWSGPVTHYPTSTACLQTAEGCAQRRLYVATLAVDRRGLLSVADPGTGVLPTPSG